LSILSYTSSLSEISRKELIGGKFGFILAAGNLSNEYSLSLLRYNIEITQMFNSFAKALNLRIIELISFIRGESELSLDTNPK